MHPITPEQEEKAVEILTTAFADDPFMKWFSPRPHFLRAVMTLLLPVFRQDGLAFMTEEKNAVALWVCPGKPLEIPKSPGALFLLIQTGGWSALKRLKRIFHSEGAVCPDAPYYDLFMIGRLPGPEHRGAGSRLLVPFLEKADEEGIPVNLETSNEGNLSYYRRLGFELTGSRKADPDGPPAWFMFRPVGA